MPSSMKDAVYPTVLRLLTAHFAQWPAQRMTKSCFTLVIREHMAWSEIRLWLPQSTRAYMQVCLASQVYQCVIAVNGLLFHVDGPFLGANNDQGIINMTTILNKVRAMNARFGRNEDNKFVLFGDSG